VQAPEPCGECGGTGLVTVISQEPPDIDERECRSCKPGRVSSCDHGASYGNGDGTRTCILTDCGVTFPAYEWDRPEADEGRSPSPQIGSKAWFARRALLWREDAEALVARLREYEECHPPVGDGVPCFQATLEAAEAALTTPARVRP
jgi:hypothetical protein